VLSVRVSERKVARSAFSIAIERPSVTSRILLSSPWLAGPMTKRCTAYPSAKNTGVSSGMAM
jgi:hypothetical protein